MEIGGEGLKTPPGTPTRQQMARKNQERRLRGNNSEAGGNTKIVWYPGSQKMRSALRREDVRCGIKYSEGWKLTTGFNSRKTSCDPDDSRFGRLEGAKT